MISDEDRNRFFWVRQEKRKPSPSYKGEKVKERKEIEIVKKLQG